MIHESIEPVEETTNGGLAIDKNHIDNYLITLLDLRQAELDLWNKFGTLQEEWSILLSTYINVPLEIAARPCKPYLNYLINNL
jgi:hypothetical protein